MATPPVKQLFPPIQWKFKRLWEIPFASAVAAATHLTLVSDALTFPFQCLECKRRVCHRCPFRFQSACIYAIETA